MRNIGLNKKYYIILIISIILLIVICSYFYMQSRYHLLDIKFPKDRHVTKMHIKLKTLDSKYYIYRIHCQLAENPETKSKESVIEYFEKQIIACGWAKDDWHKSYNTLFFEPTASYPNAVFLYYRPQGHPALERNGMGSDTTEMITLVVWHYDMTEYETPSWNVIIETVKPSSKTRFLNSFD